MQTPSTALWHHQAHPHPVLNDWLFEPGSLTARLKSLSQQHFEVQPLREGWMPLRPDEAAALQVDVDTTAWVREVYLLGHGKPWVFARSIATQASLEQSGFPLAELGTRPLGEVLSLHEAFVRGQLHTCAYPAAWLPAPYQQHNAWARRSCFSKGALEVLVCEVFLPDLWRFQGITVPEA